MFLEQFWAECDHHDKFQPRPTPPPPKRSDSYTQWSVRTFPTSAVQTITSIAVICRCLRIGPTTGRLTRSPDSRSLLWTVWLKIRTFARPGVLRVVSSAVIIRFRRWIRCKWLSWRCHVTRGLPWRVGNGLVSHSILNHTHRSLAVILTEPWHRCSCENCQNGKLFTFVHSTINDRRWFKCLIRSQEGKLTYRNISITEQDVIVCFVRRNAFFANVDVKDNKQLFWF